MKIFGVDFTSVPSSKKPITCAQCRLDENGLSLESSISIRSFDEFENFLQQPGPWMAGVDFPFGQPRKLIENMGWPKVWDGYVSYISKMSKLEFERTIRGYYEKRNTGDKLHRRATDKSANSLSPMKLDYTPVGKMFFEGAHRLLDAGVNILPSCMRDDPRIVIEAYPALVARWAKAGSYKSDNPKKQTPEKRSARGKIVQKLLSTEVKMEYGFDVHFNDQYAQSFIRDGSGDELDALLCAVQAGWAYTQQDRNYGIPLDCDPLEGWIVDPKMADINNDR